MNSAARKTEVPKRDVPVALPLKPGLADGSHADIVTDANNVPQGMFFGLKSGMTVEEAKNDPSTAEHFKKLEYMLNAIEHYDVLVAALKAIDMTTPGRRVSEIVRRALVAAGELKE